AEAVKKCQESHHLAASGQLTAATVDAINGPKRDREVEIILSNMERWRWLPRDLGRVYVMVNIPDFTLRAMKDGAQVWKTKIVSGAPGSRATPLLTETMKFITLRQHFHCTMTIDRGQPTMTLSPQWWAVPCRSSWCSENAGE